MLTYSYTYILIKMYFFTFTGVREFFFYLPMKNIFNAYCVPRKQNLLTNNFYYMHCMTIV